MSELLQSVKENSAYVCGFIAIVAAIFVLAIVLEKLAQKKNSKNEKLLSTRRIVMIGMFSAVAGVLMLLEFELPIVPNFYKLDFSELPVLICGFAFGPSAAVLTEFIKILVKLMFKPTTTAFVGELANFAVGCALVLPATTIYSFKKTKAGALIAMITGICVMVVFGSFFNAVYLLPVFAKMFGGMPVEELVKMYAEINPAVSGGSVTSFVIVFTAPLNLIKGGADALITMLTYKKLSPLLKGTH